MGLLPEAELLEALAFQLCLAGIESGIGLFQSLNLRLFPYHNSIEWRNNTINGPKKY